MISSKIVVKNMRKMIDSFEEEPDIEEFRQQVKAQAESGEKLDLLSFTGNSYGSNFFKEIEPYLAKIPTIEVILSNHCSKILQFFQILSLAWLTQFDP